jgi:hypothetical protein
LISGDGRHIKEFVKTKLIFITGGVLSSLGTGMVAAIDAFGTLNYGAQAGTPKLIN